MQRVIVCGGRHFNDYNILEDFLIKNLNLNSNIEIVSGHAPGADNLAEEFAKKHKIKCKIFKANWGTYGKSAGPIRNTEMLNYILEADPLVIAFWDGGSRGTQDMINKAKSKNVECKICYYDDMKEEYDIKNGVKNPYAKYFSSK